MPKPCPSCKCVKTRTAIVEVCDGCEQVRNITRDPKALAQNYERILDEKLEVYANPKLGWHHRVRSELLHLKGAFRLQRKIQGES